MEEINVIELYDNAAKKIETDLMDKYHDGSIAALESLKTLLIHNGTKTISINHLVKNVIPQCINVINEERENLRNEIKNKDYRVEYLKNKNNLN